MTPRDSDRLVCLELQTGRQIWTRPRGSLRRIVYTDEERVVLTGTNTIQAVDITNGKRMWQTLLQSGHISGRAATNGRVLHVPTSIPAVEAVDLKTGRILLRQPVTGGIPGNLLCVDGRMYSQSLTEVRCFSTPEQSRSSPLALAGRQLLDGDIQQGLATLKNVLQQDELQEEVRYRARRLLIRTLLESLRMDYQANQDHAVEVRKLIEDSEPRGERIEALVGAMLSMTPGDMAVLSSVWEPVDESYQQMETLKRLQSVFQLRSPDEPPKNVASHILRLLDEASQTPDAYSRSGSLIRRNDRETAAAVSSAMSSRPRQLARPIRELVNPELLKRIRNASSESQVQWWVETCVLSGFLDPAVEACSDSQLNLPANMGDALMDLVRLEAADRGGLNQQSEFTERLLTDWWDRGRRTLVRNLVSRIRLLRKNSPAPEALPHSRSVARNLLPAETDSDSLDLNKWVLKTAELPDQSLWQGIPSVQQSEERTRPPATNPRLNAPRLAIPLFGGVGAFPRWVFVQKQGTNTIHACDGDGRERWTFDPGRFLFTGSSAGYHPNTLSSRYAVAWGNLLAIRLQHMLFVLNCADAGPDSPPRLLWKLNVSSALPSASGTQQFTPQWQGTTQYDIRPSGLYPVGPFTPYGIPVYSGRRLVMLNALTGEPEWQVDGLPEDCTLTASRDELLLLSESSGSVEARNLIDGSVTDSMPLPEWWTDASENSNASIRYFDLEPGEQRRWRLAVRNGGCLLLKRSKEQSSLEFVSLRSGEVDWSLDLPQDSVVSNIVDGHLAVLSDGSRLQIFDFVGGVKTADLKVPPAANSRYLYLRPGGGRWLVLTDVADFDHDEQNPVGASTAVQVNGHVYAVDQQSGELSWSTPIDHRWLRILNPAQSPLPPVMPLLVLLKQPYQRSEDGAILGATIQASIYDARTGKLLYKNKDVGLALNYHYAKLNESLRTIEIGFDKYAITFDYKAASSGD